MHPTLEQPFSADVFQDAFVRIGVFDLSNVKRIDWNDDADETDTSATLMFAIGYWIVSLEWSSFTIFTVTTALFAFSLHPLVFLVLSISKLDPVCLLFSSFPNTILSDT